MIWRLKLPLDGATSISSKSVYSDSKIFTCISALSPIIIGIGYIGRSGAPLTNIEAILLPLITYCFPLGVETAFELNPSTLTSTTISSSVDEIKVSLIVVGVFDLTPFQTCEYPYNDIDKNNTTNVNIFLMIFIINSKEARYITTPHLLSL